MNRKPAFTRPNRSLVAVLSRVGVVLTLAIQGIAIAVAQVPSDPGWPRVFKDGKTQLTVHQPQVDYWHGFTNLHFRCAIGVSGVSAEEKFGVAEVEALTVVDHTARVVALVPLKRELRFANIREPELSALRSAAEKIHPSGQATTLGLDRLLAYLDPAHPSVQPAVGLNLEPPKIFHSSSPAILVIYMGEPRLVAVETNRTDLMFVANTNWDVLYETSLKRYYLLAGDGWFSAADPLKGPWIPVRELPPAFSRLPDNGNWAEVRQHLSVPPAKFAPAVFATTEPAELILTDGVPSYRPVQGTRLLQVSNTSSVLFLNPSDGKMYFLVAGRWFRGGGLRGPWTAASRDLPGDFARIADSDPAAFVKASVPGTREAMDAVLLASIPTSTVVSLTNAPVRVVYSGAPQFVAIPSTTVQYAVNSPSTVFLVNGGYYCCDQGVWFSAASASGPWVFCSSVPPAIYTIPPSHPTYNVTYVTVQSSTPTSVTYTQTSGYSGEYVAATGVLMFGAGILVGAAIANNNDDYHHYYYPTYPCHYSYGCAATYNYAHGGFYGSAGGVYGPYGGAGYSAGYNPSTGTYARSSYAYGPYGSASRQSAYNPYTGARGGGAQVNTAYGSAGRAAGYNPSTGTAASGGYRSSAYGTASGGRAYNSSTGASAAGGQVSTAYGSAGRASAYNPSTGQSASAGYRSSSYGTAGGVTTSQGNSAAGWNTANSQGGVVKTDSGDVYAAKDGTAYKKDSGGGWSSNSGSGWESASTPQPRSGSTTSSASSASSGWAQHGQDLQAQSQARQWGNQQSQRTTQASSSYSGRRSGGGGGRRR